MTVEEAAKHLSTFSSTNGSGQTTDEQHKEAKRIAIRILEAWNEAVKDLNEADRTENKKENKLDGLISSVAYTLDCLRALRDIQDAGDCNTCGIKRECRYAPKPGQLTRYNCPFYEEGRR